MFVAGVIFRVDQGAYAAKPGAVHKKDAVRLSQHPQLFLDDYLIASKVNVKEQIRQPTKHPANPLIPVWEGEHPWEQYYGINAGWVIYDEAFKKFRMWYLIAAHPEKFGKEVPGYTCYAESVDGVTWRKPLMDIHSYNDSKLTNIVSKGPPGKEWSECLFASVIKTPHDPSRLYKMLFTHRPDIKGNRDNYGLHVAFSNDGLHWTKPKLIYKGKCDNYPSVVWSPTLGKYFAYVRAQDKRPDFLRGAHIRTTGILTSSDFNQWKPRKKVIITDKRDGYPFVQFHHMMVTQYGDLLIGVPAVMHMVNRDEKADNKSSTENTQLVSSRDGWNWHRVADRKVFIPNGPDSYDLEQVQPRSPLVIKDDKIYIYYSSNRIGQANDHVARKQKFLDSGHTKRELGGLCLATLPADRFMAVCQDDKSAEGVLETRPLIASGKTLVVNAKISQQQRLQIELLDLKGKIISGFNANRSRLIKRDDLRFNVTWEETDGNVLTFADIPSDHAIALRFRITGAQLFAFQVIKQ